MERVEWRVKLGLFFFPLLYPLHHSDANSLFQREGGAETSLYETVFQIVMIQVFQGRLLSQAFYQFAVVDSRNSRGISQWDFSLLLCVCVFGRMVRKSWV